MSEKPPQETPGQEAMPSTGAPLDSSQQKQLDDILGALATPAPKEKADEAESPEEATKEAEKFLSENPKREMPEPVGEEDPEEDEPELEEEEEQDEPEEQGVSEGEEDEEEEVELDEVAKLRLEIAQLKQAITGKTEEAPPTEPTFEIDGSEFLSEEEADELYTNPHAVLSKVLSRVYAKAREDTYKEIPSLIETASERQHFLREARTKFWSQNGDLLKIAQENPSAQAFLRSTADQVQAENPTWAMDKIFEETGKRVRAAFNLSKKAHSIERGTGKPNSPPRRPRGHRRAQQEDTRSGVQKQIDSLIEEI